MIEFVSVTEKCVHLHSAIAVDIKRVRCYTVTQKGGKIKMKKIHETREFVDKSAIIQESKYVDRIGMLIELAYSMSVIHRAIDLLICRFVNACIPPR